MYASAKRGDFSYSQQFWRNEYRLNQKIHHYPKPIMTFLHRFTMKNSIDINYHTSHQIMNTSSQIAMPECSIRLVPDVKSSLILAHAQGYLRTYLRLTSNRMDTNNTIYTGFTNHFIPAQY